GRVDGSARNGNVAITDARGRGSIDGSLDRGRIGIMSNRRSREGDAVSQCDSERPGAGVGHRSGDGLYLVGGGVTRRHGCIGNGYETVEVLRQGAWNLEGLRSGFEIGNSAHGYTFCF